MWTISFSQTPWARLISQKNQAVGSLDLEKNVSEKEAQLLN